MSKPAGDVRCSQGGRGIHPHSTRVRVLIHSLQPPQPNSEYQAKLKNKYDRLFRNRNRYRDRCASCDPGPDGAYSKFAVQCSIREITPIQRYTMHLPSQMHFGQHFLPIGAFEGVIRNASDSTQLTLGHQIKDQSRQHLFGSH